MRTARPAPARETLAPEYPTEQVRVDHESAEPASDIHKHAQAAGGPGLQRWAVDDGPGMADVAACPRDGYSTTGTRGAGLGAVGRMADRFVTWAARPPAPGSDMTALCQPLTSLVDRLHRAMDGTRGAVLADGTVRAQLLTQPGMAERPPAILSGLLLAGHRRHQDDATIIAARLT